MEELLNQMEINASVFALHVIREVHVKYMIHVAVLLAKMAELNKHLEINVNAYVHHVTLDLHARTLIHVVQ